MRRSGSRVIVGAAMALGVAVPAATQSPMVVPTESGLVEGVGMESGVRSFLGVPYAAPPVDRLRWREPQPAPPWTEVRAARQFGPRCMQHAAFGDMNFRSDGMSEDCLYLNVWTPAATDADRLPVLVYFYGGGFVAGDGSEPRYDGESMARLGIVSVTVNYRLGAFGFLAHPELTRESPHGGSGNYGFLDQAAALRWVQDNIAAFGGDPARVTIGGESAGSISVSALMASPLSRHRIAGAIGESGAQIEPTMAPAPLVDGEANGRRFAEVLGAASLDQLRRLPSQEILDASVSHGIWSFRAVVDGHFLPKPTLEIFEAGEQADVPLLVGWNSEEMGYRALLGPAEPTPQAYSAALERLYGDRAAEVLALYPGSTREEVVQSATDLAGDRFIAYSTWKWADLQVRTGSHPVFRYFYAHPRPPMTPEMGDASAGLAGGVVRDAPPAPPASGAVHAAEIEYALGNLDSNTVFAWTPDDHRVSKVMQAYFANFVRTGDPNGGDLPRWPAINRGGSPQVMRIEVDTRAETERHRDRYLFHDRLFNPPPPH